MQKIINHFTNEGIILTDDAVKYLKSNDYPLECSKLITEYIKRNNLNISILSLELIEKFQSGE